MGILTEDLGQDERFFLKSSSAEFWKMVQTSINNEGLDILLVPDILLKCGDWHAVRNL